MSCCADVGKWIANAVYRKIRELIFILNWSAKPINLPNSLYTCDTLVSLVLSKKINVEIVTPACLPSLTRLWLLSVVFKDEDSLVNWTLIKLSYSQKPICGTT